MHPKEVLDLRADLQAKLLNRGYRNSIAKTIAMSSPQLQEHNKTQLAYDLADFCMLAVERADNFFIGADMSELIEYAATMLDKTDQGDLSLAPTKYGFAYFERPLQVIDVRGKKVLINSLLWLQDGDELIYHMWNDEYATPDDVAKMTPEQVEEITGMVYKEQQDFTKMMGRWGYIGLHIYVEGARLGENEVQLSEEMADRFSDPSIIMHPITNVNRLIHAFFLMMQQPLAEAVVERGDKKTAKRMKRAALPNEVTIIQFRRRESDRKDDGSKKKVNWTRQWIVRGYWRWQWYKDENKTPFRRRIWIAPSIRGPKDKPLVISPKVNALIR